MTCRTLPLLLLLLAGCSAPSMTEPSLALRPAESIDPRVPIPSDIPAGTLDSALAAQLAALVEVARGSEAEFSARAGEAERLTAVAGDQGSESWIAAEQALSRLIEQQGVAAKAAADVDALAGSRLMERKWIVPADQDAIRAAQAAIAAVTEPQLAAIDRLKDKLAR